MRRPLAIFSSLFIALNLVSVIASGAPVIAFQGNTVTVTGISPGAQVLWISVGRVRGAYSWKHIRVRTVTTADANGTVQYVHAEAIPTRSIWAAVDLQNGSFAIAAPEGFSLKPIEPNERSISLQPTQNLMFKKLYLEMVVVRSPSGAWAASLSEGGTKDGDRTINSELKASLADFHAVQTSGPPPPQSLVAGDVVLAFDPLDLEHYSLVVP